MKKSFQTLPLALILTCSSSVWACNELPSNVKSLLKEKKYEQAYPLLLKLQDSGNQMAFYVLGNYHVCGRVVKFSCKTAEALFTKAVTPQNDAPIDPEISRLAKNEIAWINTSCSEPGFTRDSIKAVRLSVQATKEVAMDPYSTDSFAAALASAGQFDRAVVAQRQAIQELAQLAAQEPVEPYTFTEFSQRLKNYLNDTPPAFNVRTASQNCNALPK